LNIISLVIAGDKVTVSEQIKILCVRSNISVSELARRIGKSPQNFSAKMKRESFTISELEEISDAVDAAFERNFVLNNGEKV
jgi:transcriptional regulator with XRE-family HTH domain